MGCFFLSSRDGQYMSNRPDCQPSESSYLQSPCAQGMSSSRPPLKTFFPLHTIFKTITMNSVLATFASSKAHAQKESKPAPASVCKSLRGYIFHL